MEEAIYLLCAATALACCALLLRGYRRSGVQLLLWCGLCFLAMTLENVFLFFDVIVFPDIDLSAFHLGAAVAGVALLMYGLIWKVR